MNCVHGIRFNKYCRKCDLGDEADEVSSSGSNDVLYQVEEATMKRVYFALEVARDNASEVYNDHINRIGKHPMTVRNKRVADDLKKDIDEVESLITELSSKWSFGV